MLKQKTNTIITWFESKEEELGILDSLESNGYDCISCRNKKHFHEITGAFTNSVRLIIIDLSLQEDDAISVCSELKKSLNINNYPFVIIVSDKNDEYIQVSALDSGADDYIIKPIKPRLLLKRIEAIFSRRNASVEAMKSLTTNFFIDPEKYLVLFDSKTYKLPKREFELINLLYRDTNRIFLRKEIAIALWRDEKISFKRNIDVHILNIRKILGDDIIISVKGIGYGLNI